MRAAYIAVAVVVLAIMAPGVKATWESDCIVQAKTFCTPNSRNPKTADIFTQNYFGCMCYNYVMNQPNAPGLCEEGCKEHQNGNDANCKNFCYSGKLGDTDEDDDDGGPYTICREQQQC
ncbi:hypothetical protein A4X13_0g9072 [Tilletia indica]|uniref:WSC domain-containing protein n=1 Tax=Tilletia indica TaxID=43049 RepID=A0A8T8SBJ3_9BASI|nr:hypothetical protein A4X13_0g9072 [Tilletia indica]